MTNFIELNCIEFGADDIDTFPVSMAVSEVLSFQAFTPRMRRQMMVDQDAHNEKLVQENRPPMPLKELPAECATLMLKRTSQGREFAMSIYVQESYKDIQEKLRQLEISVV